MASYVDQWLTKSFLLHFITFILVHDNGNKHEDDPNNNNTHSIDASNYYCSSCPYTNSNRLLFEQHLIHHNALKTDDIIYPCTFCTYHTNEKDTLDDHQLLHRVKDDFQQAVVANTLENAIV